MYTCICVYTYVYLYIYMHVYMCVEMYMYINEHIYICIHMYMYIHIYICIYKYVYTYVCRYIRTYTYMYTSYVYGSYPQRAMAFGASEPLFFELGPSGIWEFPTKCVAPFGEPLTIVGTALGPPIYAPTPLAHAP